MRRNWMRSVGIGGAQRVEERARAQRQVDDERDSAEQQRHPADARQAVEELADGVEER